MYHIIEFCLLIHQIIFSVLEASDAENLLERFEDASNHANNSKMRLDLKLDTRETG